MRHSASWPRRVIRQRGRITTGWAISAILSPSSGSFRCRLLATGLGREIYGYDQQLGITMMGGIFSWLFIVQAVLIGALFLGANYYLWLGMERIPGAERYRRFIPVLLGILTVCFLVWLTPHSLVASLEEARKMGGAHHPLLGIFGVMSAKNTVVNIMILTTFLSFLIYRRGNKGERRPFAQQSMASKVTLVAVAVVALLLMLLLQIAPLAGGTETLWIRWLEAACIVAAVGLTFAESWHRGDSGSCLPCRRVVVVFYRRVWLLCGSDCAHWFLHCAGVLGAAGA